MFMPTVADILTIPQSERWDRLVGYCASMRDDDDPILFHGTSALRAAAIRKEGFAGSLLSTTAGAKEGVHWGTVRLARWAAETKMEADDPPAILYARLSAILRSGEPYPDAMYEDDVEGGPLLDWRDGLERTGSLCVDGGRHVDGLRHVAVLGLPLHPRASEVRAARLGGDKGWPGAPPILEIPQALAIDDDTAFADGSDVDLAKCLFYRPEGATCPGGFR